ncbi:MAG: tRNA (guanosine(46)-N7)-methyltransferase TrmB [Candidatus Sumerlaeaceae bacterium]|nr:tRNA (guanosine(46)-N7)-methyltransferase TrmB [Candidatus Sumerlaeaceae bacterium]
MDKLPSATHAGAPISYADLEQVGDVLGLFTLKQPLELEIGCGRGDFLLAYAARKPNVNFVGVERKLVIARKAASKVARAGLTNVRIVHGEIEYLVERYLPAHAFQAIHCYFPDPWPKKRHAKRRLFKTGAPQIFDSLLTPDGWFHLRTDVAAYFDTILVLFEACPTFQRAAPPDELVDCLTGFERRFLAEGKPIYRASFKKMSSS